MEAVVVALIGALGGLLVELVRTRRHAEKARRDTERVVLQVLPNGGTSLRDAIDRIETDVRWMRGELTDHGERLAVVEARTTPHLIAPRRKDTP